MAVGTIVSRITGLIRNLLLVAVLGTKLLGDTYNVANTMPNILYNLLIGGALTAVFVPQIVRATHGADGGSAFISKLVTATSVLLAAITVIAVITSPLLVRAFAPEYVGRPEFSLTVTFMRYCLPQIFFLGIFALLGQIANAKDRFGPMMWAPVLNNLLAIVIFGWYFAKQTHLTVATISSSEVAWLGWGTTAGYVLQTIVLIPVIRQTKIGIRARFDWRDDEMRKSLHLAKWTLVFAAISQLSYFITVNISTSAAIHAAQSGITTGVGYTPYSNALLIFMLPHSIFTISIVTALLPQLARFAIAKNVDAIHDQLVRAIRIVGIITVPSAIAYFLFGPIITRALFFGITDKDAQYIGRVLAAFALGLLPMSINLIALRGLNAFENVKLQVWSNGVGNLLGAIASIAAPFIFPAEWVTVALAGALSISYLVSAWVSIRMLIRFGIHIHIGEILGLYGKLIAMAFLIAFPLHIFQRHLPGGNISHLLIVLITSGVGYLALAHIFRIAEVRNLSEIILGRFR